MEQVSPHTKTTQTSEVPQGRRQGFPKFKALPTEGTTSYAMVAKLEKDWPALRSQVMARPNVYGWSVGHYPKDRGSLQHVEPDMSHTTKTRGEDYQIHPSPLSNGNVSVPHPSCRWGTESNPMHDQRWISHKTGGGASNGSQEGASRPRTVGAFQAAPLQRRTNEVLQVPA